MAVRLARLHPTVSRLLFADDNFLFFKATTSETLMVKSLLLSGQSINYAYPGFFSCANVRRDKQYKIKDILLVRNDLSNTKYLGLPSLIERSKKL